jgi:hypothetical protein
MFSIIRKHSFAEMRLGRLREVPWFVRIKSMKEKNKTSLKYFLLLLVAIGSIFLYLYLPISESEQKVIAYNLLCDELYSVDVEPRKFKGPKKTTEDGLIYYQWSFNDNTDYLIAQVRPVNRRIDDWLMEQHVSYIGSSNNAWEKVKDDNYKSIKND